MTKKLHGSFKFNLDVLPGRHPDEVITSVQYIPANSTGKFRTFGPLDPPEEKLGMINAMQRHFFGMDIQVVPGLHKYGSHNPERIGGSYGWLALATLEDWLDEPLGEGEKPLRTILFPVGDGEYRKTEIMLPHRKVDRIQSGPKRGSGKIVTVEPTAWLRVVELGGGRLELSNAPVDNDWSGKMRGVILHSYLQEIHDGGAMTTSVQITPYMDRVTRKQVIGDDGQPVWFFKLQDIAKKILAWSQMPFEEARDAYVVDWQSKAAGARFDRQTAFVSTPALETQIEETQSAVDTGAEVPEPVQLFVLVDGVKTPIQNVPDGVYAIVKYDHSGKEIGRDGVVPVNAISRISRLGHMAALQGSRGLAKLS